MTMMTDLLARLKQRQDDLGLSERALCRAAGVSEQAVKQYFTEPKVMEGLFHIVETLFEVSIRPEPAPVWNEGVRFYRIERRAPAGAGDAAPQLVGRFRARFAGTNDAHYDARRQILRANAWLLRPALDFVNILLIAAIVV